MTAESRPGSATHGDRTPSRTLGPFDLSGTADAQRSSLPARRLVWCQHCTEAHEAPTCSQWRCTHMTHPEAVARRQLKRRRIEASIQRRKRSEIRDRNGPVRPGELLNLRLRDVLALQIATAAIASLSSPEDPI